MVDYHVAALILPEGHYPNWFSSSYDPLSEGSCRSDGGFPTGKPTVLNLP